MLDSNGNGMHHEDDDGLFTDSDPVLPDPSQMGAHNGILLREWRRYVRSLSLLLSPRSTFAFGLILYEMIEGSPAFHPKPQEEAAKMICSEGLRPLFKNKSKSYPEGVKELIQECWDPTPSGRPTFSDIIVCLNKISASCSKQTRWRDNFKLPWYSSH
ncbi:integrin-linked protein kinase 1-like [Hordeum vulgare subsp. vulgare]|uniref:integrin-linked protein kinase 1-like n=1 Tax=Hordeum vulgare subsp. vulgare TaxID=112509 RepID=UPI001D1A51B9|nr:integrin-linked protein kinase 1-like [Hordeum vulgare subsp. vulgare]